MPIYALDHRHLFPDPELAEDSGLLALGGDLHPRRVLLGYTMGIFPWYSEDQPILWHSPDPRFVLYPSELRIGRSLRKALKKRPFEIRTDTSFEAVIDACARAPRPGQDGTWITQEMRDCYLSLHRMGYAHTIEAWQGDVLAGGLYGVSLGSTFFGESMFSLENNASKIAFIHLVEQLRRWDFDILDSQVYTDHIARFGGQDIPRHEYLSSLRQCLRRPTRRGQWKLDPEVPEHIASSA